MKTFPGIAIALLTVFAGFVSPARAQTPPVGTFLYGNISIPVANLATGTAPANVIIPANNIAQGALGGSVTIPAAGVSAGALGASVIASSIAIGAITTPAQLASGSLNGIPGSATLGSGTAGADQVNLVGSSLTVQNNGHINLGTAVAGAPPVLSSCGTSPTLRAGSNDTLSMFAPGPTCAGNCTITYASAFTVGFASVLNSTAAVPGIVTTAYAATGLACGTTYFLLTSGK